MGQLPKTPGCYDLDLNGDPVNVCVEGAPGILSEPPPADNSRRLFTSITIDRTTAFPSPPAPPDPVPEIFTYTITVTDRDDEPEKVTKIHATLPPGFAYVDDSTTASGSRAHGLQRPLHSGPGPDLEYVAAAPDSSTSGSWSPRGIHPAIIRCRSQYCMKATTAPKPGQIRGR